MAEYLEHRTSDGERWDLLAFRYYADVSRQGELIAANRDLFMDDMRIPAILSAGLVLRIPIREATGSAEATTGQLPPWKR
ncbi:tail protein X [Ancylobacter sp. A5.8]|uniref:tail protein X n=1 Tax=Ancylobacter gelatini TaxID=2919920 RepID=UPI001F4D3FE0|nr:tail protein X [Ancylobacter gelatini]MCJ8142973.1 tail protein X [Ancylobacter gelatini]